MEDSFNGQKSGNSWIERLIKLAPVLLAIATATFLLNGRAFRDGYIGHFNLNSTMFDDDVGGLVAASVTAWVDVIVQALEMIKATPKWALTLIVVVLLVPLALSWVARRWARVARSRYHHTVAEDRPTLRSKASMQRIRRLRRHLLWSRPPGWLTFLRRTIWGIWIAGYLSYTALAFIGFILISLVIPFARVGAKAAVRDQTTHFSNQPSVMMRDPLGCAASYKVILCAPRFCALYSHDAIVTVPASAITWGVSEVPMEVPITPQKPTSKTPPQ